LKDFVSTIYCIEIKKVIFKIWGNSKLSSKPVNTTSKLIVSINKATALAKLSYAFFTGSNKF
jgi:hypothetical protein